MALTWMFLHDTSMRFIPGRLACAYNEEKLLPDVVYYNTNLSFIFDFIKRNVYFNIMLLLKEWQKKLKFPAFEASGRTAQTACWPLKHC